MTGKRKGPLEDNQRTGGRVRSAIVYTPNCTPKNVFLQDLADQARRHMAAAECGSDFVGWQAHFRIWNSAMSMRYGLPYCRRAL